MLFGVSLSSLAFAERLAEVEPFKTAIILRFMRDWWFVAFAVALLVAGLFVERFFCRYMCPLGAALAIPGRMRMRSEEHTSELQSLMRISYAVFCLKKKKQYNKQNTTQEIQTQETSKTKKQPSMNT